MPAILLLITLFIVCYNHAVDPTEIWLLAVHNSKLYHCNMAVLLLTA